MDGTDGVLAWMEKVFVDGPALVEEVTNGMEYTRVKEWNDDPFADLNGVTDVPPQE